MKKSAFCKLLRLFVMLTVLMLEILPYGAVCIFATPEKSFRKLFSYFSLVPYGYANFSPFITAILSCVLLALSIAALIWQRDKTESAILFVSLLAATISLAPLLLGIRFFSVVGAIISAFLFTTLILTEIGRYNKCKKTKR